MTAPEIEALGARTLADVLMRFPALFVGQDARGGLSLGTHGWAGNPRVLVLVDGVRFNDPFDGNPDLSLPALSIDTVDVYYGPGGTWFGEGSLLGVVYVTLKKHPQISAWNYVGLDQSLGGGFEAIVKKRRYLTGLTLAFQGLDYDTASRVLGPPPWRNHENTGAFARGFFDVKISRGAHAHMQGSSIFMFNLDAALAHPKSINFAAEKAVGHHQLHLIKKHHGKKFIDAYFKFSHFQDDFQKSHLLTELPTRFFYQQEMANSQRFELGTRFHLNPWERHNVYLGIGGVVQGVGKNGYDYMTKDDTTGQTTRSNQESFFGPCKLFGRQSSLFNVCSGHVWGYVQDEWKVRAPFFAVIGARAVFPIEKRGDASGELMPNIGAVISPNHRLQFRLTLQTSWRIPTFYEQSHRVLESEPHAPKLAPVNPKNERSKSIEASAQYASFMANSEYLTSLALQVSRVDTAILPNEPGLELSNNYEVDIFGARFLTTGKFVSGHNFSLSLTHNFAFKKAFDEHGFPTCRTSSLHFSDSGGACPTDKSMPGLIANLSFFYDLQNYGGVNVVSMFLGPGLERSENRTAQGILDIVYTSKPLFNYLEFLAAAKNIANIRAGSKKSPSQTLGSFFDQGMKIYLGLKAKL
jgi:outer membrane receptor protein involved in Fe transport